MPPHRKANLSRSEMRAHDSHAGDVRLLGRTASGCGLDWFSLDAAYRRHPISISHDDVGCMDWGAPLWNSREDSWFGQARPLAYLYLHVQPRFECRSTHPDAANSTAHV